MTLDEAIKHAEEVAVWHEAEANKYESNGYEGYVQSQCLENADEHRQLAKWLKELQAHRYAWAKLREDIKDESDFAYADFDEYKYEVLGVDEVDDLPNDDYRYGMERALELIDIYRPKEGDGE